MPNYTYYCPVCDIQFEMTVARIERDYVYECMQCCGDLERVITPPSIEFKGDGFYSTDLQDKAK